MNFAYGIIAIVGVLAAASVGFIVISPDDIIEPRVITPVEEKPIVCTMQWEPMCGADGKTYGNLCMLNAADVKLDYSGECETIEMETKQISVNSHIMPKISTMGDTLLIEIEFRDDDGNIVDHVNYDIVATQDAEAVLSDFSSHRHPGKHPVHETTVLNESQVEIRVTIQGLGHGDEITEPKGIESFMTFVPEPQQQQPEPLSTTATSTAAVPVPPVSHTVEVPVGSGTLGCDDSDECFLPYLLEVRVFDTVIWNNVDSAAHTVTSGSDDMGSTGVFDSGIFMSGSVFEFTFDKAGTYDYFCMVHPWMTGVVIVNQVEEMIVISEPIPEPTSRTTSESYTIEAPELTSSIAPASEK